MTSRAIRSVLFSGAALLPSVIFAQDWRVADDSAAAAGRYIASNATGENLDISPARSATYQFAITEGGQRRFWTRYRTTGTAVGKIHVGFNSTSFAQVDLPVSANWRWVLIATVDLTPGTHTFRLVRGTDNVELDRFHHTLDAAQFPVGKGGDVPEFGPALSLAAWSALYTWATPADGAPMADPDRDGKPNRLEYLWGTDPLVADSYAPEFRMLQNGGFTFRMRRSKSVSELTSKVQRSTDLVTWIDLPATASRVVSESEDAEIVEIAFPASATGDVRNFFRMVHP
jgi:hypothetical protein